MKASVHENFELGSSITNLQVDRVTSLGVDLDQRVRASHVENRTPIDGF